MMLVKPEDMLVMRDGAAISDCLPVILTGRLEIRQLEQSVSRRIELDVAQPICEHRIPDSDWSIFHKPWIGETGALCQIVEIVPIERAA